MLKKALINKYIEILGKENVFHEEADRQTYSYDSAVLPPVVPALVIRPTSSESLQQAIVLCAENQLSITVRGSGTNLSGGTIPVSPKSIVLLTNGLNKILEINDQDLYARAQPGVITAQFATQAAQKGLFYPPDPGSQAVSTLGGNVAENAGGLRGLKYGVTKDYVMGLGFFTPSGELIKTGSRTVKCVTGYNLTGLFVGSEGTLGIINEITLKLIPPPASSQALLATFSSLEKASETVAGIIAQKIVPCTLEFLDNFTIRCVEDYRQAGLPVDAQALLLIEVDGHPDQVRDEAETVVALCKKMGALDVKLATSQKERDKIWQARRDALPALARLKPTTILEDATVPRSRLPQMIAAIERIGQQYNLIIGTFGHAGDGNLHPTILTDSRDTGEMQRVEKAIDEIFKQALSLGGTLSGEHGIGLAKRKFLQAETNRATIKLSKSIKAALDPALLLNPGKIFE